MALKAKRLLVTAITFTFFTASLASVKMPESQGIAYAAVKKPVAASVSKTKAAQAKLAAAKAAKAKAAAEEKARLELTAKAKADAKAEAIAEFTAKQIEMDKEKAAQDHAARHAKNVILMIPDGMNSGASTLTRWYKNSGLTLDQMVTGTVRTFNSNSIITDSAPAGTALATGYKSDAGYVSVYPSTITVPTERAVDAADAYKPLATLLESAKLDGKATGIIATSQIQHATPATFSAHNANRNDYYDIAEQQVYENMDVVLGGGRQYLIPFDEYNKTDAKGNQIGRKDGVNLINEIKSLGYTYVEDTAGMKGAAGTKLWGMFAEDGMSYDYDRNPAKEPSLLEMTSKALDILSKDQDGFFLMVEGSQVDWAAHANDPIGVISETLAFDKAVQAALDYAKKDGNTLVVALTDHGNGGLSIGSKKTDSGYDTLQLNVLLDPLKKATLTGAGLESKLYAELNADMSNISDIVKKYYGISDLTQSEITQIQDYLKAKKTGSFNYIAGPMISARSTIGWTTTGHTGEDVTLYSYGPGKLAGNLDNTDVAKLIADSLELSLDDTNKELYAKISENIGYIDGATADLDMTDPQNPVLVIAKGSITAELPISTSKVIINGKTSYAEGLNILSKSGEVYVSWDALDIIKDAK